MIGVAAGVAVGGGLLIISGLQSAVGGSPFVPLENEVADKMLETLNLRSGETLCEPGCGDARHLITACQKYRIRGVGIEIAWGPFLRAWIKSRMSRVSSKIKLKQGDIKNADFSKVNAVFLYLAPELLVALSHRLKRDLRPGSRVVSARYSIPGWEPRRVINDRYPIFLYQV